MRRPVLGLLKCTGTIASPSILDVAGKETTTIEIVQL